MRKITVIISLLLVSVALSQNKPLKIKSIKTTMQEVGVKEQNYNINEVKRDFKNTKFILNEVDKSLIISKDGQNDTILFKNRNKVSFLLKEENDYLYPTDYINDCLESNNCGVSITLLKLMGLSDIKDLSYSIGKSNSNREELYVLYYKKNTEYSLLINNSFVLVNLVKRCR